MPLCLAAVPTWRFFRKKANFSMPSFSSCYSRRYCVLFNLFCRKTKGSTLARQYISKRFSIYFIRLFFPLICFLPDLVLAATPQSLHLAWRYITPVSPALAGFKLNHQGVFICQTNSPTATSMDCPESLSHHTTKSILTTQSPHSAPFASIVNFTGPGMSGKPPQTVASVTPTTGSGPLAVTCVCNGSADSGDTAVNYG